MSWLTWSAVTLAGLAAAALLAETLIEAHDRAAIPPPGALVDIGGRRLHLFCQGDAPGPTVVIEQGAGSPSILWWPIQSRVKAFARICTYDRAGTLWSDPAPTAATLQDRVTDLHALLHAANIPGPYVLVGHSFGGPLIRLYTKRYPGDVAGLVLVDAMPESAVFRPSFTGYTSKLGFFVRAAGLAARFGLLHAAAAVITPPPTMSGIAVRALKAFVATPRFFRTMASDLTALTGMPPAERREGGYGDTLGHRPVIVITHSEPFPGPAAVLEDGWAEAQARLAAQSTRGELLVATGCNHMIPFEAPDLVVDAIRRVVAAVSPPGLGDELGLAVRAEAGRGCAAPPAALLPRPSLVVGLDPELSLKHHATDGHVPLNRQ
jgi:pimeloyl-ACP methyl ester carboxylesterase